MFNTLNFNGEQRLSECLKEGKSESLPKSTSDTGQDQENDVSYQTEKSCTKKAIAWKIGISPRAVSKVIQKDFKCKRMHKPKVDMLLPRHVAKRNT